LIYFNVKQLNHSNIFQTFITFRIEIEETKLLLEFLIPSFDNKILSSLFLLVGAFSDACWHARFFSLSANFRTVPPHAPFSRSRTHVGTVGGYTHVAWIVFACFLATFFNARFILGCFWSFALSHVRSSTSCVNLNDQ